MSKDQGRKREGDGDAGTDSVVRFRPYVYMSI